MNGDEKRKLGASLLKILLKQQNKKRSEIGEGIRAGMRSDYLNLDEALEKGRDIVDPEKYARAEDGKGEAPRTKKPVERDFFKNMEAAEQNVKSRHESPEYRQTLIDHKRAEIHRAFDRKGVDSMSANLIGYDVEIIRNAMEIGTDGKPALKMFVNGSEIRDNDFEKALAEIAGLNDSKAFSEAAEVGKELRDQAGIQGARMVTQAGISAVTAPVRAIPGAIKETDMAAGQLLRLFFQMVLAVNRVR